MKRVIKSATLLLTSLTFSLLLNAQEQVEPKIKSSLRPFEIGEVRPEGWLKDWAEEAAKGLTKQLGDNYWPFSTGWGDATMEGWWPYEQAGYYLDGVVRLGFITGDSTLISRARTTIEAVIERQRNDGYIHSDNAQYGQTWNQPDADYGLYWSTAVFARAAVAYYSATGEQRVLEMLRTLYANFPAITYPYPEWPVSGVGMDRLRSVVNLESMIETARYASDEELMSRTLELYDNLAEPFINSWVRNNDFSHSAICHGVSYNEVAKLFAAAYPWNGNEDYLKASTAAFEFLEKNYVLPNGVNSSNEYLRGRGAFEGAESCDIADLMWSNIWLARSSGKAVYGDRIERAFFNAFPSVVSPDFTLHQYEAATNRVAGLNLRYRNDGTYYKPLHWPVCCSGNINRVLPNFIANMFMQNDSGVAIMTYSPAHLKTRDNLFDITLSTQYPFGESIELTINAMPKGKTLRLRIPQWCDNPTLMLNGKTIGIKVDNGFAVVEHQWKAGDKILLTLPMEVRIDCQKENFALYKGEQTYWGSGHQPKAEDRIDGFAEGAGYATVWRGPLLFALPLFDKTDWGFDLNEGGWQEFGYALATESVDNLQISPLTMHDPFYWTKDWAPITITLTLQPIEWQPDKGNPKLPEQIVPTGQPVTRTLLPYGCTRYRMAMFPCSDH